MDFQETVNLSIVLRKPGLHNNNLGVPRPGYSLPKTCLWTLAKVFLVWLPIIDENRAFSANDHSLSPWPQWRPLTNSHHEIECICANNVQEISQVFAESADQVIDFESWIMSYFDLDDIWLSDLIFNLKLLLFSGNPSFIGDSFQTCCHVISRVNSDFFEILTPLDSPRPGSGLPFFAPGFF